MVNCRKQPPTGPERSASCLVKQIITPKEAGVNNQEQQFYRKRGMQAVYHWSIGAGRCTIQVRQKSLRHQQVALLRTA